MSNVCMNTNMAEEVKQQRSFQHSYSKSSGDANEIFCEPCINGGKWIAVEGYCQICKEYLCEHCLKVHKNQKMTRSHSILDRFQMPREPETETSTNQDFCDQVCKTHSPEIVKFYCKIHDEPGCSDCMTLNHAPCNKDRVQDISDGFQATKEFKLIQQNLNKFHKELEMMKDTLNDNLKNLGTTYNNIQHKIASFRIQINDYLDQVQKQITEEAENRKKEHETEMNKIIADNESMKSELEDIIQKLKNDSGVNVNSIFVITKQAKQRLITMGNDMKRMKQAQQRLQQQQQHNEFRPSSQIENILSANTPMGKLSRKPSVDTTVAYRGYINAKTDETICLIAGCTLLSPERMVVTDANNNTIKLIDLNNNTVISSYKTTSQPRRVTALSTEQVAVTLTDQRNIQLLRVASTFTREREIRLSTDCYGIANKDGKMLAVSYIYPGSVEILDMQGNILHAIQPKKGNEDILREPYFLEFGPEDDTVIVSDSGTNSVSVVTFDGQILRTYTHETLVDPHGFAVAADGLLFACSWRNGAIHVVSPDFKTSNIIIKNDSNIVKAKNISYCGVNQRLYISNEVRGGNVINNLIQVYDLNE